MPDFITQNFQPEWVQWIFASLCVGFAIAFIVHSICWSWLTFWEWRERRTMRFIDYALDKIDVNTGKLLAHAINHLREWGELSRRPEFPLSDVPAMKKPVTVSDLEDKLSSLGQTAAKLREADQRIRTGYVPTRGKKGKSIKVKS